MIIVATKGRLISEIMFEVCEYIIVGHNFATSLGVLQQQDIDLFFVSLAGKSMRFIELEFTNDALRIDSDIRWDVLCDKPSKFRILPVDAVPVAVSESRQSAYQKHLLQTDAKPRKFTMSERKPAPGERFFDKYAKRRDGENDSDFEFRIIDVCKGIFEAITDQSIKESA
jgi:hypothetical protein